MWFWLSLAALLCWSGSDLFSKIGCQGEDDRLAHLKMVMAVGLVMGLHALHKIVFDGTVISWQILLTYLPVSFFYISSMTVGYLGMRYIELSISAPVCNSSGAMVAVLCLATGISGVTPMQLAAVGLVSIGVIGLGVVEAREDETLRLARQEKANRRYAKSWLALALPLIYCLLDTLGTFADALVLEKLSTVVEGYEDSANAAYELTFFAAGLASFVYVVLIRKDRLRPKAEAPKYVGALFETAGQVAYVYAMADSSHVALTAPVISAYCVGSVLLGRIFLREKLSFKHYCAIALVAIGIVILGAYDV